MANVTAIFGFFLVGLICAQSIQFQDSPLSGRRRLRRSVTDSLRKRDPGCLKRNGIFSIPGDCHHYILCRRGRAYNKTCPPNFSYDTFEHCTPHKDADCGIVNMERAENRELCPLNFGIFPYKPDCHKFVRCDEGEGTVKSCPEGQVFQEFVGCVEGNKCPSHSSPGPISDQSVCRLSPEPGSCDSAFARYYYDIETRSCHQFTYGGCEGNRNNFHRKDECMEACNGATCPKSRGVFPIPGDCKHYLVCKNGHARRKTCPEGFSYDTVHHCTPRKDADCGIPNPHRTENRELCPLNFGIFPYKADCHKFVRCDEGEGTLKSCPEGQVFQEYVGCVEGDTCPSHSSLAPMSDQSACLLPPDTGPCDAAIARYYYDIETKTCHQFTYGGCGGNGNNFHRKDECMEACNGATCPMSHGVFPIPGDCKHYLVCKKGKVRRKTCPEGFSFDTVHHCTPRKDADCGIPNPQRTENRELCPQNFGIFPYLADCHKFVRCDEGEGTVKSCPEDQVFQEFVGCVEGYECPPHSAPGPRQDQSVCLMSPEIGLCDGAFARYYYDIVSGTCKQFTYGGCGGNGNNFRRKDECMEACRGASCPKRRGVFPIPGDCKHYLVCKDNHARKKTCPEGFSYDTVRHCTPHADADCGILNLQRLENRDLCPLNFGIFPYKADCHKFVRCDEGESTVKLCPEGQVFQEYVGCVEGTECPSHSGPGPISDPHVCELPHDAGPCDSAFARYYYNSESRTCHQFVYGGCGGNENNFHRKDECMDHCSGGSGDLCNLNSGVFPYEADCHKFVTCNEGQSTVESCPEGQVYQENVGCIEGDECPQPIFMSPEIHDVEGVHCQDNLTHAHPNSCETYIQCTGEGNQFVVVQCPPDQHYNIETKECDDKCNAQCDQDLACTCQWPHCEITCTEPNGFFPVPSNIHLYMDCNDNVPTIHRCPEGKVFNDDKKACIIVYQEHEAAQKEAELRWIEEHKDDLMLPNEIMDVLRSS